MDSKSHITELAELREQFGDPLPVAVACVREQLDEHHKLFIQHSPLMCVATSDADGQPSISPKGDPPGFVHVADDRTLVIPDRPGNNRILSFQNLLENPKIALIFFVPGVRETLRIEGEARIVTDQELRELGRVHSKLPRVATVVRVTKAYFHCGKALIRSKAWQPEGKVAPGALPSFAQVMKEQTKAPMPVEQLDAFIESEYKKQLY